MWHLLSQAFCARFPYSRDLPTKAHVINNNSCSWASWAVKKNSTRNARSWSQQGHRVVSKGRLTRTFIGPVERDLSQGSRLRNTVQRSAAHPTLHTCSAALSSSTAPWAESTHSFGFFLRVFMRVCQPQRAKIGHGWLLHSPPQGLRGRGRVPKSY